MLARRELLRRLAVAPFIPVLPASLQDFGKDPGLPASSLKISLNAYSFNDPLMKGTINLEGVLDFCAAQNFDAADLTGYYFPAYPAVPPDEYIFKLKHQAHRLGIDISGTGVRNDFTDPDAGKRKQHIAHIKDWIQVASKLGAPVIRIFSGVQSPAGFTRDQVEAWMIADIKECAAFGQQHGVIVAIQNHNDFIKTGEQALSILKKVDSQWFGLVLDIGSYQQGDPYAQIANTSSYAVNWQIKENMTVDGITQKTDLKKILPLIKASGYRGYIPIETLGSGDPFQKIPMFLKEVREALTNG